MKDAIRLAVGTLTVLPVRPPAGVNRRVGSWAMTFAPVVGAALAVVPAWFLGVATAPTPLLSAALTVALLAGLTRAIHLDGLADTADGLGSGKPAAAALDIMRRSDIGPFGVVTLVLTLLVQVAALAQLSVEGTGPLALALALVVSRLAVPLMCSRGIPAARPEGLGQVVAGSVSRVQALVAVGLACLMVACLMVALGLLVGDAYLAAPTETLVAAVALAPLGLLPATLLAWRCVRRLGGVTGDVLGACVEVTFTATLVVLVLA